MRNLRLFAAGAVWAAVALLIADLMVPGLLRNPARLAPATNYATTSHHNTTP